MDAFNRASEDSIYLSSEGTAVIGFIQGYSQKASKDFQETDVATTQVFSRKVFDRIVGELESYRENLSEYKKTRSEKGEAFNLYFRGSLVVTLVCTVLAVAYAKAFFAAAVLFLVGACYARYKLQTIDSDEDLVRLKDQLGEIQGRINSQVSANSSDLAKLYLLRERLVNVSYDKMFLLNLQFIFLKSFEQLKEKNSLYFQLLRETIHPVEPIRLK